MTTIVYRDGVLAADRLVTQGEISVGQIRKISEVNAPEGGCLLGWVSTCGWVSDTMDAAKWLSIWPDLGDAPKRLYEGEATGFFMLKSGDLWVIGGGGPPFQMKADFYAKGSGWEVAFGALAMGADAVKAVEVAALYDHGTGGGVDNVRAG